MGSANLADFTAGDCIQIRTANSRYRLWLEFPNEGIGVLEGGRFPSPLRVRVTVDGIADLLIRVGSRLYVDQLGPTGTLVRRILTSHVHSVTVHRASRAA
jgi:hypothetical protein